MCFENVALWIWNLRNCRKYNLDGLRQGLGQKREYCAKRLRKSQYDKTTREIIGNGVSLFSKEGGVLAAGANMNINE